jgi:hypothetical protein
MYMSKYVLVRIIQDDPLNRQRRVVISQQNCIRGIYETGVIGAQVLTGYCTFT